MKPLISVIIPTYQHAGTLAACLDSVLGQDYGNIEVIVVDDGSTDDTQAVLDRYRDRVICIQQANAGSNPARNRGLEEARGELVIFCDADVVMEPYMLSRMAAALAADPAASIAYSSFRFGWKLFNGIVWSTDELRKKNFIHTTSLVRRKDFPGFDPAVRRFQDWDVWLTMAEHGKRGVLVPGVLFRCVIDGDSRIGSSWLPSFVYRLPWHRLPWKPVRVEKYDAARNIIAEKHGL